MSILLIILLVVAALVVVLMIAAASAPNSFTIERSIVIDRPKQQVFDFIRIMKNQSRYNKWVMQDPNQRMEYRGTDGTVGFVTAWDSDNKQVGKGEQEIVKINDGKSVDWQVRFEKPFRNTAQMQLATETVSENQTKVTWTFGGDLTFPMKLMHIVLSLKSMLAKDVQTSLGNMKAVLENG